MAETASDRKKAAAWALLVGVAAAVGVLAGNAFKRFLREGAVGDYQHYYFAAKAVVDGQNIYQQHDYQYGYLPIWAVIQSVFVPLGPGGAGAAWVVCNAVLILLGLWLGSGEVLRRLGMPVGGLVRAAVIAAGMFVMADKARAELRLGQTDATILVCFVLGLRWQEKLPVLAGAALGFIANFKFQSVVMIPYYVVRRRWAAAFWTVFWSVAIALSGVLIWGWARNSEYLKITFGSLLQMVGAAKDIVKGPDLHPLAWERSVSVPSVLARTAVALGLPEGRTAILGMAVLCGLTAAAGWWMFYRGGANLFVDRGVPGDDRSPRKRAVVLLEWAGLIMGALAFSPQTTVRHLYLMAFIVLIAAALAIEPAQRWHRWLLVGALLTFWLGIILPPGAEVTAKNPWHWIGGQLIVSMLLFFCTTWCGLARARTLSDDGNGA
jgi:hypothetical protein